MCVQVYLHVCLCHVSVCAWMHTHIKIPYLCMHQKRMLGVWLLLPSGLFPWDSLSPNLKLTILTKLVWTNIWSLIWCEINIYFSKLYLFNFLLKHLFPAHCYCWGVFFQSHKKPWIFARILTTGVYKIQSVCSSRQGLAKDPSDSVSWLIHQELEDLL